MHVQLVPAGSGSGSEHADDGDAVTD
jgi:hypothetical protein